MDEVQLLFGRNEAVFTLVGKIDVVGISSKLNQEAVNHYMKLIFKEVDSNSDGKVSPEELIEWLEHNRMAFLATLEGLDVDIDALDDHSHDEKKPHHKWRRRMAKVAKNLGRGSWKATVITGRAIVWILILSLVILIAPKNTYRHDGLGNWLLDKGEKYICTWEDFTEVTTLHFPYTSRRHEID